MYRYKTVDKVTIATVPFSNSVNVIVMTCVDLQTFCETLLKLRLVHAIDDWDVITEKCKQ